MVRVVIFVIAILGIFAGTLAYGGDRLGTWDEAQPPPPSNLQPISRPEEKKGKKDEASPPLPTTVSPDKARWIRQTNALCRRAQADLGDYDQPQTLGEFEARLVELQGKNREYNDAFAAIPPAKGDRAELARLFALFERDERLVGGVLAAVRSGDAGALVELSERITAVAAQEEEILVGLGATDCSAGLLATTY